MKTIINAAGTDTFLTAAVMPPSVRRAVERAAYHPVRLKDLQTAAGEYIARKLRCEAALVSSGASAALTLATAACIAKANGLPPEAIPGKVAGRKNEIVVQKAHRYEYDHAMQLCNVTIQEVVSLDDYRAALSERGLEDFGALCISRKAAEPLVEAGFKRVLVAERPDEEGMMVLALAFARAQNAS